MFTVKHAIMEILNKSKSLDEVLAVLCKEDQATLLATFDLMKAKLGGSMDTMDIQYNGQWSLVKNTIDYSKFNKPKVSEADAPTIDYSGPDFKPAAAGTRSDGKPKPWAGAVARRDAARAKTQEWVNNGSQGSGETNDKPAMAALRDRQADRATRKSEDTPQKPDTLQRIKDQYADKEPKQLDQAVKEVKERFTPKAPKSDEEKANEAKKKYRKETKLKAEEPIRNSIKASKRQIQS